MKEESIPSEAGPETRLKRAVRRALPWALVALVAFVLGALLVALALYVPARQKLGQTSADLEDANSTISLLTDQITTLQTRNETLQNDLDSATLYKHVLKALSGVSGARLAVGADNYAGARLSLVQATEALDTLSGLLGAERKDVLAAMQQSAARALTVVQSDLESAQPELDQLTRNLLQLEENLFPNP